MSSTEFSENELLNYLKYSSRTLKNKRSRLVLWVCFISIFFLIIWSCLAEIDEITRGDGRVVPHSRLQKIQSLEGGILKQLYVSEGQEVEMGQLLGEIDNTRFRSSFLEGKAHVQALSASVARLEAEALGKEKINFPNNLPLGHPARESEQALFNAKREKQRAAIESLQRELKLARQQLAVVEPLLLTRSVSEMEVLRLSRDTASLQGRIAEINNEYFQQAHNELSSKKAELAALEQTLPQKEDQLKRTELLSPVRGRINSLLITTRGGVIQPGQDIIEITPIDEQLLVEAKIKPKDVAFLVPGMQANVKITAYDYSIFGYIEGVLEQISPDTIEEETNRGKEAFYKILVRTKSNYLSKGGEKLFIKPGMVAEVDVINGKRTIISYFLRPLIKARLY